VGNIRDFLLNDMTLPAFWQYLKESLLSGDAVAVQLTERELENVKKLQEDKYNTWQWNFGKSPKYQFTNRKRWTGGLLEIHLSVNAGKIEGLRIFGDFLALQPMADIEDQLIGKPYQEAALKNALEGIDMRQYLGSITLEEFLATLMNQI
jgi:lipoate-protein ligase A